MKEETVLVIPTYNEAGNIRPLLNSIFAAVPDAYVLIVDDSSPDGTATFVREAMQTHPRLELLVQDGKRGLGIAYREGFKHAYLTHPHLAILGMMDADFYHDPNDLPRLLEAAADCDMVIGSVYAPGGSPPKSFSFWRRFLSRGGNRYCRIFFRYPLTDWTNAFVMIRTNALKRIDLDAFAAKEFAFIFGLKYALLEAGASWKEIGVRAAERVSGESKVTYRTILEALAAPIKIVSRKITLLMRQVGKFVIAGGAAALTQLALLYLFTQFLGIWYLFSLVLAFSIAFCFSFLTQKYWTFSDRRAERIPSQGLFYLMAQLGSLAVNAGLLYILVQYAGLWYVFAQVLIEGVLAISSFLIYKFVIFRHHVVAT